MIGNNVVPDNVDMANIVTIYKKGDPGLPQNYRPLALLNMTYKLYTIIIRERLRVMDKYMWNSQYGFRRNRSTQQPLFALRRVMDHIDAGQDKAAVVFLDWEKAFDKVNQRRMITALHRFGVPEKMCRAIEGIYKQPQFRVKDFWSESTAKRQRSGIRQGCPLSPFLFVMLLTVMLEDIHEEEEKN